MGGLPPALNSPLPVYTPGPGVRKPVKANPGLKVNRSSYFCRVITFFLLLMFCVV